MSKFFDRLPLFMVVFGGGSLFFLIPMILGGFELFLNFGVSMYKQLIEGTPAWNTWQKTPIPIFLRVSFFNITNPKDVETGAKPILREIGPYVYRELLEKVDINLDEENDVLQYRQLRYYFFESRMSNGKETDKVTFLNFPFLGVAKSATDSSNDANFLKTLDDTLRDKGERLLRIHTIRDVLFDGFTVQSFASLANDPLIEQAGIEIPTQYLDGKMGILKGRNGSDDGIFRIRTGCEEAVDFGRIQMWNGFNRLKKWSGRRCNEINGTDGLDFPPFLTEEDVIHTFVPSLCRSLAFQSEGMIKSNDVRTLRFRMMEKTLDTVERNPDNWCFCQNENITHCSVKGISNIAPCFEGAPFYFSHPHFCGGDETLFQNVDGLNPNYTKHVGHLDIHPLTGIAITVHQRLQFNIELIPNAAMSTYAETSHAFVPFLWIDEGGVMDNWTVILIIIMDIGIKIWTIGKWFLLIFLVMVTGVGIYILIQKNKSNRILSASTSDDEDDEYYEDDEYEEDDTAFKVNNVLND